MKESLRQYEEIIEDNEFYLQDELFEADDQAEDLLEMVAEDKIDIFDI